MWQAAYVLTVTVFYVVLVYVFERLVKIVFPQDTDLPEREKP